MKYKIFRILDLFSTSFVLDFTFGFVRLNDHVFHYTMKHFSEILNFDASKSLRYSWKSSSNIQENNKNFFVNSIVLCHIPQIPGLLDHALSVLNYDETNHNAKKKEKLVHLATVA